MLSRLARCAKSWASDEIGSFSLIFALTSVVLFVGAGAGVDFGRWLQARSATATALDTAVLAGARALQTNPDDISAALAIAQSYYSNNVTARLPISNDTVTFQTADNNTAIIATGNAYINTPLLGLANVQQLPLFTANQAQLAKAKVAVGGSSGGNIEVAVMLDVTGSMCDDGVGPCTSGTKITALKAAANDLVNIVVSADQSKYLSRAALVPFSTRVRVAPDGGGATIMKTLTNLNSTWSGWHYVCVSWSGSGGSEDDGNWTCSNWQPQYLVNTVVLPCVTDRYYQSSSSFDTTDDAPGPGKWLNGHGGDRMPLGPDSSDTAATTMLGKVQTDAAWGWNYDSTSYCADVDSADEIMPLTSDKSSLQARINGLSAYGSTSGALGTAWSWYVLSPNWSSVWSTGVGASGNTPGPYSDLTTIQANGSPKLRKVAVLMTDGGYNTYRGWKGQDQHMISDAAVQMCANMKAAGIEVFTVGFALNELPGSEQSTARATLQACGTDLQHFYETLDTTQLQQAFRDIGLKLSTLYLSK